MICHNKVDPLYHDTAGRYICIHCASFFSIPIHMYTERICTAHVRKKGYFLPFKILILYVVSHRLGISLILLIILKRKCFEVCVT